MQCAWKNKVKNREIRWIVREHVFWQVFQLQFMIKNVRHNLLTLSTAFYDVSVLCNCFSKAQQKQIWFSGNAGVKLWEILYFSFDSNPRAVKFNLISVRENVAWEGYYSLSKLEFEITPLQRSNIDRISWNNKHVTNSRFKKVHLSTEILSNLLLIIFLRINNWSRIFRCYN